MTTHYAPTSHITVCGINTRAEYGHDHTNVQALVTCPDCKANQCSAHGVKNCATCFTTAR